MTVDLGIAIGVIGTIIGAVLGMAGYLRGAKKDTKQESKEDGALKSDVDYIKRRVDDVLLEQRNTNKTLSEHAERITRTEESLKSLHKRLDALEAK